MISPDTALSATGGITKINWQKDFNEYKQSLCGNSKKIRNIFRHFDENVFNNVNNKSALGNTEMDDQEDLDDAMKVLNYDDSSEEENSVESSPKAATVTSGNSSAAQKCRCNQARHAVYRQYREVQTSTGQGATGGGHRRHTRQLIVHRTKQDHALLQDHTPAAESLTLA